MIYIKGQYDKKFTVEDLLPNVYVEPRKRKRHASRNRSRLHLANRNDASRNGLRRH